MLKEQPRPQTQRTMFDDLDYRGNSRKVDRSWTAPFVRSTKNVMAGQAPTKGMQRLSATLDRMGTPHFRVYVLLVMTLGSLGACRAADVTPPASGNEAGSVPSLVEIQAVASVNRLTQQRSPMV